MEFEKSKKNTNCCFFYWFNIYCENLQNNYILPQNFAESVFSYSLIMVNNENSNVFQMYFFFKTNYPQPILILNVPYVLFFAIKISNIVKG